MAAAAGPAAPRTKTKKKQKRFVPQRVKVPRAADPLLAVLAWGVNHQVRPGTNGAGPRPTGAHRAPDSPGSPPPRASSYRNPGPGINEAFLGGPGAGSVQPDTPPPPSPRRSTS